MIGLQQLRPKAVTLFLCFSRKKKKKARATVIKSDDCYHLITVIQFVSRDMFCPMKTREY